MPSKSLKIPSGKTAGNLNARYMRSPRGETTGNIARYPFNFDEILFVCHNKILNTYLHHYMQIKNFIMAWTMCRCKRLFSHPRPLLNAAQANYSRFTIHDLLLACFKERTDCVRRSPEGGSACESDLRKAGYLHQPDLVPYRDRASYSV